MNRLELDKPLVITSTLLRNAINNPSVALATLTGTASESTECMMLGTVAHCLLLEPEEFENRFTITGADRLLKATRRKEFQATGLITIKKNMFNQASEMVASLRNQLTQPHMANVKRLVDFGVKEERLFSGDYAIKPDAYNDEYFLDYKTVSMLYPEKSLWINNMLDTNLMVQLGLYYHVLCENGHKPRSGAYHLVQTIFPPYQAVSFKFEPDCLQYFENEIPRYKDRLFGLIRNQVATEQVITLADIRGKMYNSISFSDMADE